MKEKRLTRKEVAHIAGVSTDAVRKNEERWGLDKAKISLNQRVIWYEESVVVRELTIRRIISE